MGIEARTSLLALPNPLRLLVIRNAFPPRRRHASTKAVPARNALAALPSDHPWRRALSFLPSPSNDPDQRAISSPPPANREIEKATSLMTTPKPTFLYSAPRFLHVRVNTQIPEVCLIGRSNVGKSTLINALAGMDTRAAGRAHGVQATRAGLAVTSAKAGCTKTMNAYGFGPPMKIKHRSSKSPENAGTEGGEKDKEVKSDGEEEELWREDEADGTDGGITKKKASSRAEKRRLKPQRAEPAPRHSLVMMDMPGYGLNSRQEWGKEIVKYLQRRTMLRGAVVLIDAVAGIKPVDRMVLGMLRDANVRTTVLLTKADKLMGQHIASKNGPPGFGSELVGAGKVKKNLIRRFHAEAQIKSFQVQNKVEWRYSGLALDDIDKEIGALGAEELMRSKKTGEDAWNLRWRIYTKLRRDGLLYNQTLWRLLKKKLQDEGLGPPEEFAGFPEAEEKENVADLNEKPEMTMTRDAENEIEMAIEKEIEATAMEQTDTDQEIEENTEEDTKTKNNGVVTSRIEQMCVSVWDTLRRVEGNHETWVEGDRWEPEIWVTGAGDPKTGGLGIEGARLGICKLAGLVKDPRGLRNPSSEKLAQKAPVKIVSFDELERQTQEREKLISTKSKGTRR